MIKFSLKPVEPSKMETDIHIQFVGEGGLGILSGYNREFMGIINEAAGREMFEGKEGQVMAVSGLGKVSPYKILFAGTGKEDDADIYKIYRWLRQVCIANE